MLDGGSKGCTNVSNIMLHLINNYVDEVLSSLNSGQNNSGKSDNASDICKRTKSSIIDKIYDINRFFGNRLDVVTDYIDSIVDGFADAGYGVAVFDVVLESRALAGVSGGLLRVVFEVGLDWDLLLDVPVFRGSSLKGAVAGYIESLLVEKYEDVCECSRGYSHDCVRRTCPEGDIASRLFGFTPEKCAGCGRGLLLFSDMYPVSPNSDGLLVMPHVITPHYYRGGEVVEYEYEAEPVPIQHVVIAPGSRWRFVVAYDHSDKEELLGYLDRAVKLVDGGGVSWVGEGVGVLVMAALANGGIGARTTKGYGLFRLEGFRWVGRE
ncbi:MAG: type III-B CRISPR module RAMP protein Cmr6 [Desulfurococcales archaeon]|nr:type III-B CRISPR module RAMP protein Cmr6 [Desulfurococcales archaeon]